MVTEEWANRVESKLDRIAEAVAGHVAEDKAVHGVVEKHADDIAKLKTNQDKQKGRAELLIVVSLLSSIVLAVIEGARYFGGH